MAEPVSLSDLKAFARIDTDADDALVESLGTAATAFVVQATGRALTDMDERAVVAIKALVATWYEHRESVVMGTASQVPMHVSRLIHQLRNWSEPVEVDA